MRHRKHTSKLNRTSEHRAAMLRNLAKALVQYERIHTTKVKADQLRPFLEGVITMAKEGSLHARRLAVEGAPGYVDTIDGPAMQLTLFQEGGDIAHTLKPGLKVRVAPAGIDRKPTAAPVEATVTEAKMAGNLGKTTLTLASPAASFHTGMVARLWLVK